MAFTFFFRDSHTLELAVKHLLPLVAGRSIVRIWDAGCAMGQEPYTLTILLAEFMGTFAFKNVQVLATDLDPNDQFGPIVEKAVYPFSELERIPADYFQKYFESHENNYWRLVDSIRNRVRFSKLDLLELKPIQDDISLIVCKNVLLHFQPSERISVIEMFYRSLMPHGLLVMEQTQKMPEELLVQFEQVVVDAQLYRKK